MCFEIAVNSFNKWGRVEMINVSPHQLPQKISPLWYRLTMTTHICQQQSSNSSGWAGRNIVYIASRFRSCVWLTVDPYVKASRVQLPVCRVVASPDLHTFHFLRMRFRHKILVFHSGVCKLRARVTKRFVCAQDWIIWSFIMHSPARVDCQQVAHFTLGSDNCFCPLVSSAESVVKSFGFYWNLIGSLNTDLMRVHRS